MRAIGLSTLVRVTEGSWVEGPLPEVAIDSVSTDTRALAPGELFFALRGERFDGHDFVADAMARGACACVVARDRVPALAGALQTRGKARWIAVDDPLAALERLAVWQRRALGFRVTAVTGSVGKTTTKEFLRTLLARRFAVDAAPKSFNNRLGVALTLLGAGEGTEELVVEMGTSGPGELSYLSRLVAPDRVVVTAVAPAHLAGLGSLEGVIAAKLEVLDGLDPHGPAYLNASMPGFERFAARVPGRARSFGETAPGRPRPDFALGGCRPRPGDALGYELEVGGEWFTLPVAGRHNIVNALAAFAVARDAGVGTAELRQALFECRLPPGRLDVRIDGGVVFVDDSYNANPRSMESALEAFAELAARRCGGRRIAVLGDMLELGPESRRFHEGIGRRLAEDPVDVLITIGADSRHISGTFARELASRGAGARASVVHFDALAGAREYLDGRLGEGDMVLFKASNLVGIGRLAAELRAARRPSRSRTS
jgi:UDP-N-acetylmuramoyl-tripeptide--D-alanyl-D-alanine ligase